jgi:hypothetical protein
LIQKLQEVVIMSGSVLEIEKKFKILFLLRINWMEFRQLLIQRRREEKVKHGFFFLPKKDRLL